MSFPLSVNGEPCWLRPAGTLWLPQFKTLVVADLHLEKGSSFAAKGQLLPPYDTRETLDRLMVEVTETGAERLVLLGDSLHDMGGISRMPVAEREALIDLAERLDLVWITGNHDPDGGTAFGGREAETLRLGRLTLRHDPVEGSQPGEVSGHLHPCAILTGVGGRVRRRCFVSDGSRLILPAFGAFTGGLSVTNATFRPLFSSPPIVYLLGNRIVPVGFARLGHEGGIRRKSANKLKVN